MDGRGTYWVAQWLRLCAPNVGGGEGRGGQGARGPGGQGARVQVLVRELDPTYFN